MTDLDFQVEGAEPAPFAAVPLLLFKLRVRQGPSARGRPIHAIALRCQIRIEPARRRYGESEQEKLSDLFDAPHRWSQTLRPMLWAHTSVIVPPFQDDILIDLPVPCTFDFNVAATKYFDALAEGDVPISLLFSGTVFYEAEEDRLQVAQIPWEKESRFRLPAQTWKDMMNVYYPNTAWLCLRRDAFDQLYEYKRRCKLPIWEQALEKLLATANGVESA
jgi:hypothetical protein